MADFVRSVVALLVQRLFDIVEHPVEILVQYQPPLDVLSGKSELDRFGKTRGQRVAGGAADRAISRILPDDRLLIEPPLGHLARALDCSEDRGGVGRQLGYGQDR